MLSPIPATPIVAVEAPVQELSKTLNVHPETIRAAMRRGLLAFRYYREQWLWRLADSTSGTERRVDGEPVSYLTRRHAFIRLGNCYWPSGLQEVIERNRRDVVFTLSSLEAIYALELARREGTLEHIGVVFLEVERPRIQKRIAEHFRGRRVRVVQFEGTKGQQVAHRLGMLLRPVAEKVDVLSFPGLRTRSGAEVQSLADCLKIALFERQAELGTVTDFDKVCRKTIKPRERATHLAYEPPRPKDLHPVGSLQILRSVWKRTPLADRLAFRSFIGQQSYPRRKKRTPRTDA